MMRKILSIAFYLIFFISLSYAQGLRQFTEHEFKNAKFNRDSSISYLLIEQERLINRNAVKTIEYYDGKYGEIYNCNLKPIVLKNGKNNVGTYKCQRVDTTKYYNQQLQFTHYEIHNSFGGVDHIVWFEYHKNGTLHKIYDTDPGATFYKKKYTEYNDEGQLVYKIEVMNGNNGENSFHTIYNNDGSLFSSAHFYRNKLNGLLTYYYPNGKVKNEYHYLNNDLHGVETDYLEDGTIWRQIKHENGKIVSLTIKNSPSFEDNSLIENGNGILYNFDNNMEKCSIETIKNGKVKTSEYYKDCPCISCEFDGRG